MNRRRAVAVLLGAAAVSASLAFAEEAPAKKRVAPPVAPTLTAKGVRYLAITHGDEAGRAGLVSATSVATGRELWRVQIFSVRYDFDKETDVQDLFIATLKLVNRGRTLLVTDERGGRYGVALKTRAVTKL